MFYYILCHVYRPNTIYCAHYMLYPAQFHPLYIVAHPLLPASALKTQHIVSNPIQPLYVVLQVYYIQHSPIYRTYIVFTTTFYTISCTCAFSAPFPFALPTIYCVSICMSPLYLVYCPYPPACPHCVYVLCNTSVYWQCV